MLKFYFKNSLQEATGRATEEILYPKCPAWCLIHDKLQINAYCIYPIVFPHRQTGNLCPKCAKCTLGEGSHVPLHCT